jgi:hypothetical protein
MSTDNNEFSTNEPYDIFLAKTKYACSKPLSSVGRACTHYCYFPSDEDPKSTQDTMSMNRVCSSLPVDFQEFLLYFGVS